MRVKYIQLVLLSICVLLLSGCLYPEQERSENKVPNETQLKNVQDAVTQYKNANNGLLPIKTNPEDTPIFRKYTIEFEPLIREGFIDKIPGNAFQNGGFYEYTIIDPEKNPTVKIVDLRITEKLRSYLSKIEVYRSKHTYPPFGKEIGGGLYEVAYKKLNLKESLKVDSPYSDHELPVLMNEKGELFVDYSTDLYEMLKKTKHSYKEGDDIRFLLTDETPFVPINSVPYTVKDGEPIFLETTKKNNK